MITHNTIGIPRLYCLELQSDIEFPQLLVSNSDSDPDVIISERDIGRDAGVPQDIKYEIGEEVSWLENSTCYLRIENGNRITKAESLFWDFVCGLMNAGYRIM